MKKSDERYKKYMKWKYRQPKSWWEKRAKAERDRRKSMGEEYRIKERERGRRRKEYRKEYGRKYYLANKKRLKREQFEYRKNNPGWSSETKRRRITRRKGLPATLTHDQWKEILKKYNHRCAYCKKRKKLFREHDIPMSRGGGYTADNIVPACGPCNSRKNTKTGKEFIEYISKIGY